MNATEAANTTTPFKIGLGCDPEIFLMDKKAKRYCSAHDLVPGSKASPHPLTNGAVQPDGVALEYNTKPAYSGAEFAQYNSDVMKQLREMVPKRYGFSFTPAVIFDKYFFDSLPDDPKELGCNPDYNAYTRSKNPRPVPRKEYATMRTGSGHLHISWTEGKSAEDPSHRWDCEHVVKCLEAVIGRYLTTWDDDRLRKNLYGAPGCLRYRTYGVEWRTPSNAWLNYPELWSWLYDSANFTVQKMLVGDAYFGYNNLDNYKYRNVLTRETLNAEFKARWADFPEMPEIKKSAKEEVYVDYYEIDDSNELLYADSDDYLLDDDFDDDFLED